MARKSKAKVKLPQGTKAKAKPKLNSDSTWALHRIADALHKIAHKMPAPPVEPRPMEEPEKAEEEVQEGEA